MNTQSKNQEKKEYKPVDIQVIHYASEDIVSTSLMLYRPFYGEDDEFVRPTASNDISKNV